MTTMDSATTEITRSRRIVRRPSHIAQIGKAAKDIVGRTLQSSTAALVVTAGVVLTTVGGFAAAGINPLDNGGSTQSNNHEQKAHLARIYLNGGAENVLRGIQEALSLR